MAVDCLDEKTAANVLRQVEFYFSDSNLPRDNFLKRTVQESEDGLVSLALICSFARMRSHLGLGVVKAEGMPEKTVQVVAEVLRKSNLLKVSDDGKRVGRTSELSKPEEVMEQVDSRTVAASPLPYDTKIEDVESFFSKHGKVNSVRLPRLISDKNHFCGTALIEFSEEDDAKKVLSATVVYAGEELEMRPKKDFDAERSKQSEQSERSHKDGSNESYQKGLIVAFKLKSVEPEGSVEKGGQEGINGTEAPKTDGNVNDGDEKEVPKSVDGNVANSSEDAEKENREKVDTDPNGETNKKVADTMKDGRVKVKEVSSAESAEKSTPSAQEGSVITREDLKELLQRFGTVKYIDFKMGDESGYIRFEDSDAAVKARAAAVLTDEGGFILKKHIVTLEPLSGDAENKYWSMLLGNKEKRRENNGSGNRGRGKGNWGGGRRFDGKRQRQSGAGNARPNKIVKFDADE